jgi:hypothetical protein
VLKAWTLVLTHKLSTQLKNLLQRTWISQWEVGGAQEAVERLFKWLGTSNPQERGGMPFIGIWKTSRWGCQSRPIRPVHHIGQTCRVSLNWLRALTEENSLRWQNWVRIRICPERGQTSSVEFKFQRSYGSPDMSDPRSDISKKCLWNPVKGPNKSGELNLF